jgi:hypothetical protein
MYSWHNEDGNIVAFKGGLEMEVLHTLQKKQLVYQLYFNKSPLMGNGGGSVNLGVSAAEGIVPLLCNDREKEHALLGNRR